MREDEIRGEVVETLQTWLLGHCKDRYKPWRLLLFDSRQPPPRGPGVSPAHAELVDALDFLRENGLLICRRGGGYKTTPAGADLLRQLSLEAVD